jgi:GT2 family glycosyltransferase
VLFQEEIERKIVTGFSGGLLMVFGKAGDEYISVLNNDILIDSLWPEKLVKAMDEHPEAGICA